MTTQHRPRRNGRQLKQLGLMKRAVSSGTLNYYTIPYHTKPVREAARYAPRPCTPHAAAQLQPIHALRLRRPVRLASSTCGRHEYSRCLRQTDRQTSSSDRHQTRIIFTARRYARSLLSPGVRPSVCPSVTLVDCIQTAEDIVKLFVQPGSPIILVF